MKYLSTTTPNGPLGVAPFEGTPSSPGTVLSLVGSWVNDATLDALFAVNSEGAEVYLERLSATTALVWTLSAGYSAYTVGGTSPFPLCWGLVDISSKTPVVTRTGSWSETDLGLGGLPTGMTVALQGLTALADGSLLAVFGHTLSGTDADGIYKLAQCYLSATKISAALVPGANTTVYDVLTEYPSSPTSRPYYAFLNSPGIAKLDAVGSGAVVALPLVPWLDQSAATGNVVSPYTSLQSTTPAAQHTTAVQATTVATYQYLDTSDPSRSVTMDDPQATTTSFYPYFRYDNQTPQASGLGYVALSCNSPGNYVDHFPLQVKLSVDFTAPAKYAGKLPVSAYYYAGSTVTFYDGTQVSTAPQQFRIDLKQSLTGTLTYAPTTTVATDMTFNGISTGTHGLPVITLADVLAHGGLLSWQLDLYNCSTTSLPADDSTNPVPTVVQGGLAGSFTGDFIFGQQGWYADTALVTLQLDATGARVGSPSAEVHHATDYRESGEVALVAGYDSDTAMVSWQSKATGYCTTQSHRLTAVRTGTGPTHLSTLATDTTSKQPICDQQLAMATGAVYLATARKDFTANAIDAALYRFDFDGTTISAATVIFTDAAFPTFTNTGSGGAIHGSSFGRSTNRFSPAGTIAMFGVTYDNDALTYDVWQEVFDLTGARIADVLIAGDATARPVAGWEPYNGWFDQAVHAELLDTAAGLAVLVDSAVDPVTIQLAYWGVGTTPPLRMHQRDDGASVIGHARLNIAGLSIAISSEQDTRAPRLPQRPNTYL